MEEEDALLEEYHDDGSGGFDVHSFTEEVPEEFNCPVCKTVMKEPVQTSCGHQFCEGCLLRSTLRKSDDSEEGSGQLFCPGDRKPLPENGGYFPDLALKRKILSMKALCNHKEYGCDWEDELRHFQDHLSECGNRIVPCDCCNKKTRLWLKKKHELECPYFLIDCPKKCGVEKMCRKMMESHIKDDCPMTMVSCPFQDVGCSFNGQRMNLMEHCDEFILDHLIRTQKELQDTKEELEEAQEDIRGLSVQNLTLKKRINECQCSSSTFRDEVKEQLEKNADKFGELEAEIISVNERLNQFESQSKDNIQTEMVSLKNCFNLKMSHQIGVIRTENKLLRVGFDQMVKSLTEEMGALQKALVLFKARLDKVEVMKGQIDDLINEKVSMREEEDQNESLVQSLQRSLRSLEERFNQFAERFMSSGSNENRDMTSGARKGNAQSRTTSTQASDLLKKQPHVDQVRATNERKRRIPKNSCELPYDSALKKKKMELSNRKSSEQPNVQFVAMRIQEIERESEDSDESNRD